MISLTLIFCCLLILLLTACGSEPDRPSPDPDYQVIMWVLGGIPENEDLYFQRLRDLHVAAIHVHPGDSPDSALAHGLGFYLENIHRIAFLHEREPIYKADWDAYTRTRDQSYLLRKPCLHDPEYLARAKRDIQQKISAYAGKGPLLYDLGDECSITSYASPMDYCFSDHTLAAFRTWLQEQYGSLGALNAEWETDFATWDDVVPMTTYGIKDREKTGSENYAPWADHRTFMDVTFADSWRTFRDWVREIDPNTPVGLEGTQMPAAFGGYDLWRLSQVLDWIEPYDIGEAHGILRSFIPDAPTFVTLFEHDPNLASRRLWHLRLNGDRGVIIWASSEWFDYDTPTLEPKPWVAGMADLFAELQGPAAQAIAAAKRDRPPIAIHYSHPSIQVAWMIDSRDDGDTWHRRFSSYEAVHSHITRDRSSWCRLLEDLGYQYEFVSAHEILDGTLEKRGYRALILPESLAISEAEAAAIERFAQGGGSVMADFLPGVFDEHGKRRRAGVLDDFFGVSRAHQEGMISQPERSLDVDGALLRAEPDLRTENGEPVSRFVHAGGAGSSVYLNLSPIDYAKLRLQGEGSAIRDEIAGVLADIGIDPAAKVIIDGGPPVGCEVITYTGDEARYLAIMRRPEYQVDSLGEIGYTGNSRFEVPVEIEVDLGQAADVRELLSGESLGRSERVRVTLGPWKPVVLEVRQ